MKKLYQIILTLVILVCGAEVKAQMVSDIVSVGPGYTNQAFYSMSNGELSNVSNTDWDLAFQIRGFAASILINSKRGVNVWKANKDASQWASMTTADTTGIVSDPSYQLFNSDTSWDFGALNRTNNASNQFDLGWGVYDFITHVITGDSIFFIKLGPTDYRKLRIDNLTGGVYTFRTANLDGSNEVIAYLNKTNFAGKFFGYYSIVNNTTIDREPMYNTWDLTFCQYFAQTPLAYMVTGVLSNDSVMVAKAYPADTSISSPGTAVFSEYINSIGYEWKSFNMGTFTWDIADSTVYFVTDRNNQLWKMVFTGFDGSSSGNFYFNKGPATPTGLLESTTLQTFGIYPNPTSGVTRLMVDAKQPGTATVSLVDMNGREVAANNIFLQQGLNSADVDFSGAASGIYQVVIRQQENLQISRLVIR